MSRKIELMHELFGRNEGRKCGECSNLVCGRYRDRILRKCKVYGLTHSEASDWTKHWEACGLFGKPYAGGPVIEIAKRRAYRQPDVEVLDGQIGMDDILRNTGGT